ncbi:DNA ligase 4 [Toxorhynchites rutilus septentrionalis]|uniref:DNA ligase 4 n=1 Tax=Toxorhynchites rutilus septentrionalis TaxID=329112 RepID=UPI002479D4F7|nr:DNA ligase 4 [Toxorhynchites rutilus septentrionalis]
MSDDDCISKHVKFSEISTILEKVKGAGSTAGSKRDEIFRRYFASFEQFRREYCQKYGDKGRTSIFPILRLLLPGADRERDSYGIRMKSLRDLYIKVLGIGETSIEARKLSGFDESGFAGGGGSGDFADRIFTLMRGRCAAECKLTVWDVNQRLDAMAEHYKNAQRARILDELIRMVGGLTQLDQKWLIRIILKNLRLGMSQQKLLGLYHPRASALFDRYSYLSKVCEAVESDKISAEEDEIDSGAVKVFHPIKPMLCQRVDLKLVDSMLKKDEYWLETKMDGERFQLHKEGQVFKYFSRNSFEYSHVFGENANHSGSTLTPYLADLLSTTIQSVVLDGEMMVFDKNELTYRDKSENTDVKAIKRDNPTLRPCFCVYDILYLNGKCVINVPYAERIRLLETVVKTKVGILVTCFRVKVKNSEHLVELLNQAIDARQEGVVIKKQDSTYSPNLRNAGWYKIKPDYIDNLVSDFDLLIIGGFYNMKRTFVNTFLVGVMEKVESNDQQEPTYLAVTKVGIGLSDEQWKVLSRSLKPYWREVTVRKEGRSKVSEEPPGLRWGQTYPDVWIPPKHSIVLQMKGSELVRTKSFATAYTIRFPRITAIRSDKTHLDVCTRAEFDQLCSANTTVAKLAKRHVTASDLVADSDGDPTKARKRKKISPIQPNRLSKANLNHPLKNHDDIQPIDDICSGLDFCILSTSKGLPSIGELETMVRRHGGRVVKNPGPSTYATIVGDRTFLVDRVIYSGRYNVATVDWLLRALGGSESRGSLAEFKPNDMLAMTASLREQMVDQFDRFGDSYTVKISGVDDMRALLAQISLDGAGNLSSAELRNGQREILGRSGGFRIFRGHVGRLYEENLTEDIERFKARFVMLKFVREGGEWLSGSAGKGITIVFVYENDRIDRGHLKQWVDSITRQNLEPCILKLKWIQDSLCQRNVCNEQLYSVF